MTSPFQTAFGEAQSNWDATSAPGWFNYQPSNGDPMIEVRDGVYAWDAWARAENDGCVFGLWLYNEVRGTSTNVDADYTTLASIEELSSSADVVVVGTVGRSLGTEVDGGGDSEKGEEGTGILMEFFSVAVDDVLQGKPSNAIVVAWPDSDDVVFDGASPVESGSQLLLFLRSRDPQSAPGIESFDLFYVPTSGDMGVFDIIDGRATARSEEVRSVTVDGKQTTDAHLEVPLTRVVEFLEQTHDGPPADG